MRIRSSSTFSALLTARLTAGSSVARDRLRFEIDSDALAFYGRDMKRKPEAGRFHLWVGGSAAATLHTEFELLESE